MKKILSLALIATLSLTFLVGCGNSNSSVQASHDAKVSDGAIQTNLHDNEAIIKVIKKAADVAGWDITEFKSNELIAEKTSDGNTISSTIKLYKGYIEFENSDASDLKDAVKKELQNKDSGSH